MRQQQVTEEEYWLWVASEALANPNVDIENVGPNDGSPDYFARLLAAGKDAVAMRKEERDAAWDAREAKIMADAEGAWEDNGCWPVR